MSEPAFPRPLHVGGPNVGLRARFFELVSSALDVNWLTNDGQLVRRLESTLAEYLGVGDCVLVCNGTVALEVAARSLGLRGEVILPSLTFIASASAIAWLGIRPVFCDVDSTTYCIDPAEVERHITPDTSAILGVHLFGRPCDVESLDRVAAQHHLTLLYDAAHAFGCSAEGRMIGNFGACEVFSFHATKFYNSFEGGAIVTNDPALAQRARSVRNFGYNEDGQVERLGINGKMNEACAAAGIANFESLNAFVECNKRNYNAYRAGLNSVRGIRMMEYDERERNNYQYIVVEVLPEFGRTRDQLMALLHADNVLARSYFSPGCHSVEPFCSSGVDVARLQHTTDLCERLLTLPTGTRISVDDVRAVVELVRAGAQAHA